MRTSPCVASPLRRCPADHQVREVSVNGEPRTSSRTKIPAMRSRLGLLSCSLTLGLLAMTATPAAGAPLVCAAGTTTTTGPSGATKTTSISPGSKIAPGSAAGGTCWAEEPYPFVGETAKDSIVPNILTVTSMAFRAWNRGLAATTETGFYSGGKNPLGVWFFNGAEWFPTPGFPGSSACPGHTIVWAGKKDYWLVGGAPWQNLCRFDGELLHWDEIPIPKATLEHVAEFPGSIKSKPG